MERLFLVAMVAAFAVACGGGDGAGMEDGSVDSSMPDAATDSMAPDGAPDSTVVDASPDAVMDASPDAGVDFTGLVLNEVDYDQPGGDTTEFVEVFNAGAGPVSLAGLALVLVNGRAPQTEYHRVDLGPAGSLAAGEHLVIGSADVLASLPVDVAALPIGGSAIQNGAPDAVGLLDTTTDTLVDALSYEGEVTMGTVTGGVDLDFVEGTATGASDTGVGALVRFPDGSDTDDADTDWWNTARSTPGAANLVCPAAAPSPVTGFPILFEAIDMDEDIVVLRNTGGVAVDMTGYFVCVRPAYLVLPAGTTIASGGTLVVHLTSSGVDTATEVFLADGRFALGASGEFALYNSGLFGSSDAMEAFVAWGAAAAVPTREDVAVAAGLWTAGDFATPAPETAMVATGDVGTGVGYTGADAACVP